MIVTPRDDIPAPWKHQAQATAWAVARKASYFDMDMGTGKSRCVIDALQQLGVKLTLVITTKRAVTHVWPGQYEDWTDRTIEVIPMTKGTVAKRIEKAEKAMRMAGHSMKKDACGLNPPRPAVLICNWEMLRSNHFEQWLKLWDWGGIVGDEMHKIKSHTGGTSKAVARVWSKSAAVKVALSGTPMPHDPLDIWAQYRSLAPEVFGTRFGVFRARIAVMGGYRNPYNGRPTQVVAWQNLDWMREQLAATMFQPLEEDVELDLPPTRHIKVTVELEPANRKLYDIVEAGVIVELDAGDINPSNALVKLLRLQQLASGIAVSQEVSDYGDTTTHTQIVGTAKQDALAEIFEGTTEPVVVFCVFHAELDSIHKAAESVGAACAEVSGRRDDLDAWKYGIVGEPQPRILAVQIQAGSEALDFTMAHHCAFLSTGFNMGTYLQALKRCDRPGQEHPVTFYHLAAERTIDSLVYETLLKRGDLVKSALAGLRDLAPV